MAVYNGSRCPSYGLSTWTDIWQITEHSFVSVTTVWSLHYLVGGECELFHEIGGFMKYTQLQKVHRESLQYSQTFHGPYTASFLNTNERFISEF